MSLGGLLAIVVLGLAALSFASSSARAEDEAQPAEEPEEAEDPDREAKALFVAGQVAFDGGRYERALTHFRAAYAASQRPELLYNIGLAADRAHHPAEAEAALRAFVEFLPEHPHRLAAEIRIEALRKALQAKKPPTTWTANSRRPVDIVAIRRETQDPEATDSDDHRTAAKTTTAVGGSLAVVGGLVLYAAAVKRHQVENAAPGANWKDYEGAYNQSGRLNIAGAFTLTAGAAALGVGIWLWLLPRRSSHEIAQSGLRLEPRATGVQLRGQW